MNDRNKDKTDIRIKSAKDNPENSFDQVNKYGTYNIQPTSDTDNEFPAIAQGLPKSHHRNAKK